MKKRGLTLFFFFQLSVGVVLSLLFVEFVLEEEMKSLFYMQFVHDFGISLRLFVAHLSCVLQSIPLVFCGVEKSWFEKIDFSKWGDRHLYIGSFRGCIARRL